MPVQDGDTLKSYFDAGDVPTHSNYVDLIDTILVGGGGGVNIDHALLTHLAYVDAAHTGFAGLEVANSFTLINPLTTIAESWIGPSSTTGVYFKGGNVGIGTTAPTNLLTVNGNAELRTGGYLRLRPTNNSYNYDLQATGNDLQILAGSTPVLYVQHTGNVGIGTTSPGVRLDIVGGVGGSYGVYSTPLRVGGTSYTYVEIVGSYNQAGLLFNRDGSIGWLAGLNNAGSFRIAPLVTINETGVTNAKDGAIGITILSGGNIGINNIVPNAKLEITSSWGTETPLKFSVADWPDNYFIKLKTTWSWDSAAANKFIIGYSNAYVNGDALTIQGDGNVGIGTTVPTHKLEVDGDLAFVGAQSILTTADNLTLAPAADLNLTPGGTARVRATSGVRLQSDNYASQTTGWGISYLGSGDFRYLYADEMHVKAFIADLEQALAGGQIICKSVAPLASAFTAPAPAGSVNMKVEVFKGFDTFRVFVDGDMIRLRQFERGQTTTNLITNPSFEVDLAGWSGDGSRIATGGKFGTAYLDCNTVSYTYATIVNATAYTFSFYCKGDYALNLDPGNGAYYMVSGYADPGPDGWARVTHTFTSLGTAFAVYLYTHNYDAIQLELGASATSYCDGSLGAGYYWNGTPHASTSYRGGVLDISNCWGTVVWVSTDTIDHTQTYTFTRSAAPNAGAIITGAVIAAGVLVLDYGTTGNGFLESNAMDGAQAEYAPYHQIVSWITHPNSGLTVRTRLGNLRGIFNTANEYGLYAGAGVTDADQYLRISNTAVEAHNLPIKMYDGASVTMQLSPTIPSFAMGSTLPSAYGTGDGLWMGKDTAYKFRVGDVDGEMFAWDGSYLYLKADANNYLKVTGTNLQYWANAQLMLEIANTPAIALGLLSGENICITSTSLQIRHATTERIGMTSAGVMTINDSAGAAVITLNASTGAEITKKLTMPGANSAIAIGSTPPTSATVGTGLWLDRTGLYGLAANVLQTKVSATDGKIYAGGGNVVLDDAGLALVGGNGSTNMVKWYDDTFVTAYMYSYVLGASPNRAGQIKLTAGIEGNLAGNLALVARGPTADVQLGLIGSTSGTPGYGYIDNDLRVQDGLYVGNITTDPAVGTAYIKLSDAGTGTYPYLLTLNHATSDTPVAGFGSAIIYRGETSGTGAAEDVAQSQMMSQWVVADHATRTAKWTLQVVDTAARTIMIGEASGSVSMVGFLGHAAVARAAHLTNPTTTLAAFETWAAAINLLLENFGFMATS